MDNDASVVCYPNTGACNNDFDGDLGLIRKHSYVPGIRAMGALFAMWEEAIRRPILTVTVHKIEEKGDDTIFGTLGLDDYNDPDFYVGMVMGKDKIACFNWKLALANNRNNHTKS